MRKTALKLNPKTRQSVSRILRQKRLMPGYAPGEVIEVLTAIFGNRIEADLRIVNAKGGPRLAPVLLHNGTEVAEVKPSRRLGGEYSFVHDGEEFIVAVVAE